MQAKDFFSEYLTKITSREKLDFLNNEVQKLIKMNKGEEASILSIFIELLSSNLSKANKRFEELEPLTDDNLIHLIAKGSYYLIKGHKESSRKDLQDAKKYLEMAREWDNDIPFLDLRLARAYRYLGSIAQEGNKAKEYDEAIKLITEALSKVEDNKVILSKFYNELGSTYLDKNDKNDNDSAKEYFLKAIETNSDLAFAYTGMGNYYRSKYEHMEAISWYNKALENYGHKEDKFKDHKEFVYPLNYLGDCYRFIEDYSKAEENYLKAIKVDPSHPYPWHGLGRIHYELGNRNCNNEEYYKMAITYYEKSTKLNPKFKYVKSSLGSVYYKLKYYKKAIDKYSESIKEFPVSTYHDEWAANRITEIENQVKLDKKIAEFIKLEHAKELLPEEKMIINTINSKIDEKVFIMKNSFAQTFLKEKLYADEKERKKATLEILRRWNSYTPIITDNSKGGGYFVKAYDQGIVIDPGFNFIDNFKDSGHTFAEIDSVLISHAHDDHTADLESIINLLYRYNKELKSHKIRRHIAKARNISLNFISEKDPEVTTRFNKYKKILYLYISPGVMEKYLPYFKKGVIEAERDGWIYEEGKEFDKDSKHTYVINEIKFKKDIGKTKNIYINKDKDKNKNKEIPEIQLTPIKAKHEDVIKNVESLGYRLDFKNRVLVYTGDTGWSSELEKQYEAIRDECKRNNKKVILLAHIGGFDKNENALIRDLNEVLHEPSERKTNIYKPNEEDKEKNPYLYLYDNHLGRVGLVKINEALQPDICIISEFGEEFKGLRIEFAEAVEAALPQTRFIPADIGLKIDLKDFKIKAISRIDYENRKLIYEYVNAKEVKFGEYKKLNQLFYFKPDLDLGVNENTCLQALFDGFTEKDKDFCSIEKHRYLKNVLLEKNK